MHLNDQLSFYLLFHQSGHAVIACNKVMNETGISAWGKVILRQSAFFSVGEQMSSTNKKMANIFLWMPLVHTFWEMTMFITFIIHVLQKLIWLIKSQLFSAHNVYIHFHDNSKTNTPGASQTPPFPSLWTPREYYTIMLDFVKTLIKYLFFLCNSE